MPQLYARLIANTASTGWTIDIVPERHKQATLELLHKDELDGYGKPL